MCILNALFVSEELTSRDQTRQLIFNSLDFQRYALSYFPFTNTQCAIEVQTSSFDLRHQTKVPN